MSVLRRTPQLEARIRTALAACPAASAPVGPILFAKGAHLVTQGADNPYVYLHLAGWAHTEVVSVGGDLTIVDFLLAGDLSGWGQGQDEAVSVVAMSDVLALRFQRDRFLEQLETNDALRALTLDALTRSLARVRDLHVALRGRSAVSKVCHVLALLAERAIAAATDGPTIPISQLALARAVDLSPVAVNRAVQSLRRAGLLEWGRVGVRIFELERLRAFA